MKFLFLLYETYALNIEILCHLCVLSKDVMLDLNYRNLGQMYHAPLNVLHKLYVVDSIKRIPLCLLCMFTCEMGYMMKGVNECERGLTYFRGRNGIFMGDKKQQIITMFRRNVEYVHLMQIYEKIKKMSTKIITFHT